MADHWPPVAAIAASDCTCCTVIVSGCVCSCTDGRRSASCSGAPFHVQANTHRDGGVGRQVSTCRVCAALLEVSWLFWC